MLRNKFREVKFNESIVHFQLDPTAGKIFMGFVVASNPFGQMLFSPLFGWWGNKIKSVRVPLFCSIAIFCIASGMYSTLEYFPARTVKYWMLLSRFLVGVGSGIKFWPKNYEFSYEMWMMFELTNSLISSKHHTMSIISIWFDKIGWTYGGC